MSLYSLPSLYSVVPKCHKGVNVDGRDTLNENRNELELYGEKLHHG